MWPLSLIQKCLQCVPEMVSENSFWVFFHSFFGTITADSQHTTLSILFYLPINYNHMTFLNFFNSIFAYVFFMFHFLH